MSERDTPRQRSPSLYEADACGQRLGILMWKPNRKGAWPPLRSFSQAARSRPSSTDALLDCDATHRAPPLLVADSRSAMESSTRSTSMASRTSAETGMALGVRRLFPMTAPTPGAPAAACRPPSERSPSHRGDSRHHSAVVGSSPSRSFEVPATSPGDRAARFDSAPPRPLRSRLRRRWMQPRLA
jgi:hypothetical protein